MEKGIDMKTAHEPSFVELADAPARSYEEAHLRQNYVEGSDAKHLFLVLAADCPRFTVVAISATLAGVLHTPFNDARGCALSEVLWLTPEDAKGIDAARLAASLGRVLRTGKPDAMPMRLCDISQPSSSSLTSLRWWSAINFPMSGADGRVCHIVHRLEDVTSAVQMQLARALWSPAAGQSRSAAPARKQVELTLAPSSEPVPVPVPTESATTASAARALESSGDGLVLIAANQQDHSLMRAAFDVHGYRTIWARTGREALTSFAQQRPNKVLLDLTLPEIDGLSTCRAMRDLSAGADAAIICLSAQRDAAVLDNALLAGADDVLEKPVHPYELFVQLQAALLKQPSVGELRVHSQKLRRQRYRLSRLQLHRERLASYIVHDLKEPLSCIDLRAALLLLNPAIPEDARDSLERIRVQVRSALLQVLNLLDIHMHDEGRLVARNETVDLPRLVQELLADFDAKAQLGAITLHSDIAVDQVHADPDLLRRVLANLLDNALRHAPARSEVTITAQRIGGSRIELFVLNTGECIPEEMRERIFDPFVQVDATGGQYRSRAGRGLGLAFCKLAVEAQGGQIQVAPIAGKTAFTINLAETPDRH